MDLHVREKVAATPGPPPPADMKSVRCDFTGPQAWRRGDFDVVPGQWRASGFGEKKKDFFLLLIGIVMVLDYFTGGVNIACYPVYLLKISV